VGLTGNGKATTPPIVIVNQPAQGSIVGSGSQFTVGFGVSAASGGGTIVSYVASLSLDGGATFTTVLAGPGAPASSGINSFIATAPNTTTSNAVVKVQVTDSNSLVGTGLSGFFTIGTPPVITSVTRTKKLFVSGTGIQLGAVVVIQGTGETFTLTEIDSTDFVIGKGPVGSFGDRIRDLSNPFTFTVRNPNGLSSASAVALR